MTRFVHIGDIHLQAGHARNADRLQAFDQVIREGLALEQLGAWLVPGDLFHTRSTIADRNDLVDRLLQMAAKAPICIVRGNHDQPGDLDIFAELGSRWPISVFLRPGVHYVALATGETAAIAAVPYPDKHGLVVAGVQPSAVSQTAAELLDVIFMQLAGELAIARASGAIPIGMGHFNVRGSVASTGQPQIGLEQEIDRASLSRLGVAYFALSHIHKAQEVGEGVYAGSIAAMDHGETEAKSYVVVEAERNGAVWQASWTRQPIQTPPMFHVDGVLDRHGFSVDSFDETNDVEIHRRLEQRDWSNCDVRVRYRYNASEKSVLNDDSVRDLFTGALRLKVEGVAIADRELRAPEVAAAKTLPEKLAAFRKEPELSTAMLQKLYLLEHVPTEAELLARVAETLKAIEQPAPQEATVAA